MEYVSRRIGTEQLDVHFISSPAPPPPAYFPGPAWRGCRRDRGARLKVGRRRGHPPAAMPRARSCPSCGQMCLISGFAFHVKQCKRRQVRCPPTARATHPCGSPARTVGGLQAVVELPCMYCDKVFPQFELGDHARATPAPLPQRCRVVRAQFCGGRNGRQGMHAPAPPAQAAANRTPTREAAKHGAAVRGRRAAAAVVAGGLRPGRPNCCGRTKRAGGWGRATGWW